MSAIDRASSTCKRSCLLACIIFFACANASAQRDLPPIDWNTNWDFGVWVAGSTGEETTNSWAQAQLLSAGVFGGRVFTGEIGSGWHRGRFEYAFDAVPLFITFGNQNTHGGGFDPVIIRWNSSLHTSRVAPYIELAGGCVAVTENLPPGRTSGFNFTAKGGGGVYLFTRDRHALDIGLQWSHISNANLGFWNPEFNGLQLRLGFHWYK
jgi:Lipid A 3-O-deacylase (PagL)